MFDFSKKPSAKPVIVDKVEDVVVADTSVIEETILPAPAEVVIPDTTEEATDDTVNAEDAVLLDKVFPTVTVELRKLSEIEGTLRVTSIEDGIITLKAVSTEFITEVNPLNSAFTVGTVIQYNYNEAFNDYLLLQVDEEEDVIEETVYEQPIPITANVIEEFNNFLKTDTRVIEVSFDAIEQYMKLAASRGLTGETLIKEAIIMMLINDDDRDSVPESEVGNYKAMEILGSSLVSIRGDLRKSIRIKLPEGVAYKQEMTETEEAIVELVKTAMEVAPLVTKAIEPVKVKGFVKDKPAPVTTTETAKEIKTPASNAIPADYPLKYETWNRGQKKKWCKDNKKPYIS